MKGMKLLVPFQLITTLSLLCNVHTFTPFTKRESFFVPRCRHGHHYRGEPPIKNSVVVFGVQSSSAKNEETIREQIQEGDVVGSGSYGTVHLLYKYYQERKGRGEGNEEEEATTIQEVYIGKRPWQVDELKEANEKDPKERASRCLYYWQVEEHCFSKLPSHPQLPPYQGTITTTTSSQRTWMVFGFVGDYYPSSTTTTKPKKDPKPAPTLENLMELDVHQPQHLTNIGQRLGTLTYGDTLDKTLESLLNVLVHVHKHHIVHRDIKPSNLLVHNGTLLLMDFGSAADLEPTPGGNGLLLGGGRRRVGLESGNRVAVSPIYCAPEVFVDINNHPTAFDIFSSGLLFCQLLFGYLEERMDAGFHQQLEETDWDLNIWLSNELGSKLRPRGLDDALDYLAERPGLWTLLEQMLSKEPSRRPSAEQALKRLEHILIQRKRGDDSDVHIDQEELLRDGPFFTMVIESMETCEIPTLSRPLHFVATFARNQPLGLMLSERDDDEDENDKNPLWIEATKDAMMGEVFVKEILPGGQADELGIFEIGDRLQGIGELPFTDGGFEKAVEMLQDQPRSAKYVKLHFDRIRVRKNEAINMIPSKDVEIQIEDLGAWSTKGKRKAQEDAFVLHEIHDTKDRSVLVAGVMDGHGGTAASTMVANEITSILSNQVVVNRRSVPEALEASWNIVCKTYQQQCMNTEECVADYDPREGILMANTGSQDLIAGTTASVMALDEKSGKLSILNCGDSRSLVVAPNGKVQFVTTDHTPQSEEQRLMEGIDAGLKYSLPKCRVSKWTLSVGDYEYSVGRSLEGPFATSKGIVSDPDVDTIPVSPGEILISATDGLWEVMDSEEVAIDLQKMRKKGLSARDAARTLCSMAIRKGTPDNVSAVVVYL